MKGLYEILTERMWMVNPDFVHGIRKAFEQNLNAHTAFVRPEKTSGFVSVVSSDGSIYYPEEYQISEDGQQVEPRWALSCDEQKFPFVSVISVDGPITRNGGGCSYGSMDHRDMIFEAADHPLCRGHVFIINTPGGSAWAKNDYEQAIMYARSKGQPVIAFVDGMCASAGMYLASLCDERYFMHPKNQIGCIGVMAAFYTEADGGKNQYTNETYHELYDPESFDKNKCIRDIANDGDSAELIKELADLGVEFRADVKKACPGATEEHLHGKMFNAEVVVGSLMDGQSTFLDVVQRAFALNAGTATPVNRIQVHPEPNSEGDAEMQSESKHTDESKEMKGVTVKAKNENQTFINMKNYPLINAACGLNAGDIAIKEEGAFMNTPLLDTMEAYLKGLESRLNAAQKQITELQQNDREERAQTEEHTKQIAEAVKAREVAERALADANQAHAKALEELSAQHDDVLTQKNAKISELTEKISTTESELKEVKETLATTERMVDDQRQQIESLTNEPSNEPEAGEAPVNNGEGLKIKSLREFDPSLYKTNSERKAAFERFKRGE